MVARLRGEHQGRELGDALLDQRLVAGIGNVWKAESLWHAQLSPWLRLDQVSDDELVRVLGEAARLMRAALDGNGGKRAVYKRAGRPCPRCGTPIRVARPGRRQPHRLLVPRLPKRRGATGRVEAIRGRARPAPLPLPAPVLSGGLLAARGRRRRRRRAPVRVRGARLARAELALRVPAARPQYVEARAERLSALADARLAIEDLGREPAAAIYAAAHSGKAGDQPLLRTIVLPLLADVAEACGGFDWSDEAFDRAYVELERSLLGERRTYAAVAPLLGLSVGAQVELADGMRIRVAAAGELAAHWPEANGLLPAGFGTEPDRLCVLELERSLLPNEPRAPDAPGELADAVSALRLATAAPVAVGPVLFERLDWRPLAIRPMLPIAAT